jgi:hypothetical protein
VDLPVIECVHGRSHIVEFVVIEIGVDVGGHGDRRVAQVFCSSRRSAPARRAKEA